MRSPRLAAAGERLRIGRDLHDLLGHTLSLVALKSELARRLVETPTQKAQREIADVESIVRSTLKEVRKPSRLQEPDLAYELHAAQEMLSAAGIQFVNRCDPVLIHGLSQRHNEALAWTVREGVTNVIHRSLARTCSIELRDENTGS